MTNGWSGADPNAFDDGAPTTYTLATRYTANADIVISAVRVWHGATSASVTDRTGHLWSTSGDSLATVVLDSVLPSGWTEYALGTPVEINNGTSFDVSYDTTRYYGIIAGGYPRDSDDDNVTAIQGRFAESHDTFPTTAVTNFYGIDVVYTVAGENVPPAITGVTALVTDSTVQVTATLTDETPGTVTLNWNWGDGNSTNTGGGVLTADHTYTDGGLYAIVVTATDAGGLTDVFGTAVQINEALTTDESEEWVDEILSAVVSDVQRSGFFDKVNRHEPKKAPGTGLTAAVWVTALDPIALASGLASTSARLVFTLRMYQSMLLEPQDMIDPRMTKALSNLMRRYHDDFDFEGLIRNIDLLGQFGVSLSAISGYLDIDGKMFRIVDMTIPCIVNDVWPQVR